MQLGEILVLEPHGPDTRIGTGPRYPWGGLYGGQIVAQALIAAGDSVPEEFRVHSLRAYFIRRGDPNEPIRFEIDRIRNGRSFCTRRVVARQATGAILNLEASFQRPEPSAMFSSATFPTWIPDPGELGGESWSPTWERRDVPRRMWPESDAGNARGRLLTWFRAIGPLSSPLEQAAAVAYISDDLPTEAVVAAHPLGRMAPAERDRRMYSASLDHSIWFHEPFDASDWHLHDIRCEAFVNSRGLTIAHLFRRDGVHVATVEQEVLLRDLDEFPPR